MKEPEPFNQLLVKINAALKRIPPPSLSQEGVIPHVNGSQTVNGPSCASHVFLEDLCGIKKQQLLPESTLSDEQIHCLVKSLKNLLAAHRCPVVFQQIVPERIQYRVIRERFNQQVPTNKNSYFTFSLCEQPTPIDNCIMGKDYCHCSLLDRFFETYGSLEEENPALKEIEDHSTYILKKRYGADWQTFLGLEDDPFKIE